MDESDIDLPEAGNNIPVDASDSEKEWGDDSESGK
jgi:hypothetical protein